MVLMVGVVLMVMRMGEAMRVGMVVGAVGGAVGGGMIVHAAGVPRGAGKVKRRVIA
jgi:hypothetical protein